jgi:predicted dehydrogenase
MDTRLTRRTFLGASAALLASTAIASPNDRLNIAVIGVGGRGRKNLEAVGTQNIVALCDVDSSCAILGQAAALYPKARVFSDFRKMLQEVKEIEAVVISTPDHVHAPAAVMAMKLGKHVYCEKPLSHSIHEARVMAEVAAKQKVATQMGNQGHASDGRRMIVELIRSGAIGPITEVHAWVQNPIWPQGLARPEGSSPVPQHLNWDLWLGPAPDRPYKDKVYHPFNWRGWWDFGNGALGDMGCHVIDSAYWGLRLGSPSTIEMEGDVRFPETGPKKSIVRFTFPARESLPPVSLTWYDGGHLPPAEVSDGVELPRGRGAIFVGRKGKLIVLNDDRGEFKLLPEKDFAGFVPPAPSIAKSPGHHEEWIRACKGDGIAGSNFSYGVGLTEICLLGGIAWRSGRKLEWDGAAMKAPNCPEACAFLQREYRKGWTLS